MFGMVKRCASAALAACMALVVALSPAFAYAEGDGASSGNASAVTFGISIAVADANDDEPLNGAKLQLVDADGTAVDSWTQDGQGSHVVEGVAADEPYELLVVEAPRGYAAPEYTISLMWTETGEIDQEYSSADFDEFGTLLIGFEPTSLGIAAVDKLNGTRPEGGHFQLLDSAGAVVDEWSASSGAHVVDRLVTGEAYTVHVEEAPEGYASMGDVQFRLQANGMPEESLLNSGKIDASHGYLLVDFQRLADIPGEGGSDQTTDTDSGADAGAGSQTGGDKGSLGNTVEGGSAAGTPPATGDSPVGAVLAVSALAALAVAAFVLLRAKGVQGC